MREVFQTVHEDSLREGKEFLKRIVFEIERVGVDLPNDVIALQKHLYSLEIEN